MRPLSEIAGLPPSDTLGLHKWLIVFWEYEAANARDPENRDYCEDEAWRCSRLAAAIERDQQRKTRRALAQQEAA